MTDAQHLPVMTFPPLPAPPRVADSLISSHFLSSPFSTTRQEKDVQDPNAVGAGRGSPWPGAQELVGDCRSGGTVASAGLQACKSLLSLRCIPSGGITLSAKSSSAPFPVLLPS